MLEEVFREESNMKKKACTYAYKFSNLGWIPNHSII